MLRSRSLILALCGVLMLVTFALVFIAKPTHAATIVRSKSNIANNRSAPIGDPHSGSGDVIVRCESCSYPPMPEEGCLILMDSQTGEIWAYCDDAVVGGKPPLFLGKLKKVGAKIDNTKLPK